MTTGNTSIAGIEAALLKPYVPSIVLGWKELAGAADVLEIEGTLVHLDITGSTALADHLLKLGKEGSEEVAFVLDERFGAMLTIAPEYGGDLLKFGGDSLLLLFRGDQHARRAVAAAHAMRARLRSIGPHRRRRLRMTVGVHSGLVSLFLCGHHHRELIVTGPALTNAVALGEGGRPGSIRVGPSTAECLPPSTLNNGLLCRPVRTAAHSLAVPDAPADWVIGAIPRALREHLATDLARGEHRPVAVGFLRFDGVDAVLRDAGPQAVAERLQELTSTVQDRAAESEICPLYVDASRDGGQFVLVAGVPTALADAEQRLLSVLREVVSRPSPFPIRAGVNRGRVFAGDIGTKARRAYTILGDSVNVAARIMAHAAPGSVLASEDVVRRTALAFPVREVAPFAAKGKRRPVRAYSVEKPGERASVDEGGFGRPAVGRVRELSLLMSRLEASFRGVGDVVELAGAAGIGKTRLVQELRHRSPGIPWFQLTGHSAVSGIPYYGIRSLLRWVFQAEVNRLTLERIVHERAPNSAPWLPLIGEILDIPFPSTPESESLAPEFRSERAVTAMVEFLTSVCPSHAAYIFDDLHYVDASSRAVIARLAAEARERSWFFLVTTMGPGSGLPSPIPDVEVVELSALPPDAIGEIVTTLIGSDAHPTDIEAIADRAEGNPFYAIQLCEAYSTTGEGLPDAVETAITASIDVLPPAARQFLRIAAILGPGVHGPLLSNLARANGQVARGVPPAALQGFLQSAPDPPYLRFNHRLVQEAAYESLPFRERRSLHRQAAELIQSGTVELPDRIELLAYHYSRAGAREDAWHYSVDAARRAASKHANAEVVAFLELALDSVRRNPGRKPDDLAEVYELHGDACDVLARYPEADASYSSARRLLADLPVANARLMRKQALLKERVGRYPDALRMLGRATHLLEHLEHSAEAMAERAEVFIAHAGVRFRQGRYVEAAESCRQAMLVAQAAGLRSAEAHAYYLIENTLSLAGHPEAIRYRDRALPIFEEVGDLLGQANVLNNLGVSAYHEGRPDEALALWERSRHAREAAGDVVGAAIQLNNIAEVYSDRGDLETAADMFRVAKRTFDQTHSTGLAAVVVSNLGRLATRSGRFDEGEELLQAAVDVMGELGATAFEAEAEFRLAENEAARGHRREALERIDALEARLARGSGSAPLRVSLAQARAEWSERPV